MQKYFLTYWQKNDCVVKSNLFSLRSFKLSKYIVLVKIVYLKDHSLDRILFYYRYASFELSMSLFWWNVRMLKKSHFWPALIASSKGNLLLIQSDIARYAIPIYSDPIREQTSIEFKNGTNTMQMIIYVQKI